MSLRIMHAGVSIFNHYYYLDEKSELGYEELMSEAYMLRAMQEKVLNIMILESWPIVTKQLYCGLFIAW